MSATAEGRVVKTNVPARLDRLPWSRFHWLIVIGLGVSWVLDGLEIQIVATVGTVLLDKGTLHLSVADVTLLGSIYLLGEVVGALVFGRITDRIGRKKMFVACLALYLFASGLGGFAFNLLGLALNTQYRVVSGAVASVGVLLPWGGK